VEQNCIPLPLPHLICGQTEIIVVAVFFLFCLSAKKFGFLIIIRNRNILLNILVDYSLLLKIKLLMLELYVGILERLNFYISALFRHSCK